MQYFQVLLTPVVVGIVDCIDIFNPLDICVRERVVLRAGEDEGVVPVERCEGVIDVTRLSAIDVQFAKIRYVDQGTVITVTDPFDPVESGLVGQGNFIHRTKRKIVRVFNKVAFARTIGAKLVESE